MKDSLDSLACKGHDRATVAHEANGADHEQKHTFYGELKPEMRFEDDFINPDDFKSEFHWFLSDLSISKNVEDYNVHSREAGNHYFRCKTLFNSLVDHHGGVVATVKERSAELID